MIRHDIEQKVFEQIFKDHSSKARVILRASKVKGDDYDKYRNTGYTQSYQNPLFIQALTRTLSTNSLIVRELGLVESGAIAIIIQKKDLSLLKLAEKITVDNVDYTPWHKSLGGKIQIEKAPFDFYKILLFRINE